MMPPMPSAPPIERLEQLTHARRVDEWSLDFARYVSQLYASDGAPLLAWNAYADRYPRRVDLLRKAAIAAGTSTDATWAKPLVVGPSALAQAFLEYALPATIIGRLPLRKVPFNTPLPTQSQAATYRWTGEGRAKALSTLAFTTTLVPVAKAAGLIVLSAELLKLSAPNTLAELRRALADGLRFFLDGQFIDPAVAPVADVSPGSITHGLTPIPATADPKTDLTALVKAFTAAHKTTEGAALVLSPANALAIGMTSPGLFTELREANLAIVTSAAAGSAIVLLAPADILLAQEGELELGLSRATTLQMSDTPTDPADATTVYVSLWESNFVALRAEQMVSWLRTSNAAVAYIANADYYAGV